MEKASQSNKKAMPISTIKLTEKTKKRLINLKVHKRESYEEVLIKVLEILNLLRINPEKARYHLLTLERERKNSLLINAKNIGETTI